MAHDADTTAPKPPEVASPGPGAPPGAGPVFVLDGTPVELVPQDRNAFAWLASQVYRRMHEGPPLPAILTVFAHDGTTTQGIAAADPRIQSILWTLWQMGVGSARIEGEGDQRQVKWDRGEHPTIESFPFMENFTEEGIRQGRALAASLVSTFGRRIRVNGVEMPIRVNNIELLQAQAAEMEKRRTDPKHDPVMAAAAYVAELISQGSDQNDLRLRAALELAADLGVRSMMVDPTRRQLRIEGFNEQACLAGAYLQGAPLEDFPAAVNRAQVLNRMASEEAAKLAQGGQAGGAARAAGPGPAQKPVEAAAFKRRRR